MFSVSKTAVEVIRNEFKTNLDRYFALSHFDLPDNKVKLLREVMELVYLRNNPLVAVDVEAYERNLNLVTEIGVAIYDPEHQFLSAVPRIKSLHIIIDEHRNLKNGRFVPYNIEKFTNGTSYSMKMAELKGFLTSLFRHYLIAKEGILVGHNLSGDVKWLRNYGISNEVKLQTVDTDKLFRYLCQNGASLRKVLRRLHVPHAYLHNAANDAYYTLLACIALCDPAQRVEFGLDTWQPRPDPDLELSNKERAEKKRNKVREKFSDDATVIRYSGVPSVHQYLQKPWYEHEKIEVPDDVEGDERSVLPEDEKKSTKKSQNRDSSNQEFAPSKNELEE